MSDQSRTELPLTESDCADLALVLRTPDPLDDHPEVQRRWLALMRKYPGKNALDMAAGFLEHLTSAKDCCYNTHADDCPRNIAVINHGHTLTRFVPVYGSGGGKARHLWQTVMAMPWTNVTKELAEAIPPYYTEFLGAQIMSAIKRAKSKWLCSWGRTQRLAPRTTRTT